MYGLEYSTALLMNLCLHKSGKAQCVPIAGDVLNILVTLIVQDHKQVCFCWVLSTIIILVIFQINPYINGAMYSLLSHKDINKVAQNMEIESKILEKCQVFSQKYSKLYFIFNCQDCEEETKKQLEYILDQLRSPDMSDDSGMISDEETDDTTDEDIYIEEEIDEADPVLARNDEISGFVLLEQRYLCKPIMMHDNTRICNNPDFVDPDDRPIRPKTGLVDRCIVYKNKIS